ncbi:LysE family translocator [Leeia sp. TBRC 13508]|uniref:LysE family translocator n=1 Tax=Leeia speluncae TaxID=2884804 RepID=A0ABS8D7P8_9NEIS|nr:LysE family translocator [Leeia speluncae]MCB6184210.1 LysE family translocator [Leeia speluncae]
MIDIPLLFAFIAAAFVLTITPGVDTALVLRAATMGGRKPAAMAGLGVVLGCLIWGAAVSLGLGAILQASEVAYNIVKFVGAGYLVLQGIKLLRAPRQKISVDEEQNRKTSSREAFLKGFITNILNPKVGVFYITFLPQFVPAGANIAAYSFMLACVHVLLSFAWFAILIMATVPLGQFLRRPAAVKWLDRLTGFVFIAFGLKLAASSSR